MDFRIDCKECGKPIPQERLKINNRWGKPTEHCSKLCYKKEWYRINRERVQAVNKKYLEEHKEEFAKYSAQWYKENKERLKPIRAKYRQTHKKEIYAKDNRLRETNEIYRLKKKIANNIRSRLKDKGLKKDKHTEEILGCTIIEFKKYLEKNFKPGMSWKNYGIFGWHIDHITPMAKARTLEEAYKLWHYTNLQPLWAGENLAKGVKITGH